jgi:hypothetical protein
MTLNQGDKTTQHLPAGQTLTVVVPANSTGRIVRLANSAGEQAQSVTALSASSTTVLGPYANPAFFEIACLTGSLAFTLAALDTDAFVNSEIANALAGSSVVMSGLPTSDPAVAGALWNNSGTVKVSAGA